VGICFPTPIPCNGTPVTGDELLAGAKRIEELGFAGIWMPDVMGRGYFALDPLVGLAAVAAVTDRVELGTSIVQAPLSDAASLARQALSAALVGRGRFVLGVGAGSTRLDFEITGRDYDRRFQIFEEHVQAIRSLWAGEQTGAGRLEPWPELAGGPPVLIGSWEGGWIERAAAEFDGWIGSGAHCSWDQLEAAAKRFRQAGGRRAVLASVVADLDQRGAAGPDDRVDLRCPSKEALSRLNRLVDYGIDDVILMDSNRQAGHLERLAELNI